MSSFDNTTAAKYGCSVNKNGGIFEQGKTYNIAKKILVKDAYLMAQSSTNECPNLSKIARQCKVGHKFVKKVEQELLCHGDIIHPCNCGRRYEAVGPGARTLANVDAFVLLHPYLEEPSRHY